MIQAWFRTLLSSWKRLIHQDEVAGKHISAQERAGAETNVCTNLYRIFLHYCGVEKRLRNR